MTSYSSPNKKKSIDGRGTKQNPANRFDLLYSENDPEWDPKNNPTPKTEFYRDTTKQIISYSNSPDLGSMASINPYRGCEHGCIYCYARPGHEYFGFSSGLDFETKIFVKEKAASLLRKELSKPRFKPRVLVMSGVTDPYQPIEKRFRITRQCLEELLAFRNPVGIITKNHLVTRDLDIFKAMHEYRGCCVNVSVTTLDSKLARVMEPRTSHPKDRLKAIEQLSSANIPVRVMVAPIIPGINDHEIPSILNEAVQAGAKQAGYVMIRLPWAIKELFEGWLEQYFPERKNKVLNRIRSVRKGKLYDATFGQRMSGEGVIARQIAQLFHISVKKAGLTSHSITLSCDSFRNPYQKQLTLFQF